MFFWSSLAFSMIRQILAIWSLVPLPSLNPASTSGSSQFTYCWSLAWRILSIILLTCEMSTIAWFFKHSLALPFFWIRMKTDLFQSRGHCWVFQICWHIECGTFKASSFRIWNSSSTGIPRSPLALFVVMLPKAHLISHSTTPWTVTHQAPLSMGLSRQEYWSRLPCPSPGDLPDPGIEPVSPVAPALQTDSLYHWATGEALKSDRERQISYDITYMWNLKKSDTNELIYKTKTDSQTWKINLWLPKGKGQEREKLGVGS